jgi:DNA-binding PadR family transcriptional regulator
MTAAARRAALTAIPREEPLTPVQYAMLGLLHKQPSHGYQLQRSFTEGSDLEGVVHLEQASMYAALKDLASRELIVGSETREGTRPPRTVYALTDRGKRALDAWLKTPVERLRQVRLDFLLKVYFARQRSEAAVRGLVDAQIATCHRYLADLEARAAELAPESFAYLVTQSRTSAARSTLEWLREYHRRLE